MLSLSTTRKEKKTKKQKTAFMTVSSRVINFPWINITCKFYTLQFQMIIPGSWIFAAIVNIPLFLAKNTKMKKGRILCVPTWREVWMEAFIMILSVVVGVSLVLMIVLYSRVVYTLWFQRSDEHHLNIQQKVQILLESIKKVSYCHYLLENYFSVIS